MKKADLTQNYTLSVYFSHFFNTRAKDLNKTAPIRKECVTPITLYPSSKKTPAPAGRRGGAHSSLRTYSLLRGLAQL